MAQETGPNSPKNKPDWYNAGSLGLQLSQELNDYLSQFSVILSNTSLDPVQRANEAISEILKPQNKNKIDKSLELMLNKFDNLIAQEDNIDRITLNNIKDNALGHYENSFNILFPLLDSSSMENNIKNMSLQMAFNLYAKRALDMKIEELDIQIDIKEKKLNIMFDTLNQESIDDDVDIDTQISGFFSSKQKVPVSAEKNYKELFTFKVKRSEGFYRNIVSEKYEGLLDELAYYAELANKYGFEIRKINLSTDQDGSRGSINYTVSIKIIGTDALNNTTKKYSQELNANDLGSFVENDLSDLLENSFKKTYLIWLKKHANVEIEEVSAPKISMEEKRAILNFFETTKKEYNITVAKNDNPDEMAKQKLLEMLYPIHISTEFLDTSSEVDGEHKTSVKSASLSQAKGYLPPGIFKVKKIEAINSNFDKYQVIFTINKNWLDKLKINE